GALLALPIGGAVLLRAIRSGAGARAAFVQSARGLLECAAAMIGAFLVTSPFIVLDWSAFRQEFALLETHMEGGHFGHDPTRNGALVYLGLLASRFGGAWLLAPAALGIAAAT